ncbi:MAG: type II toxin-antitoxin system prevent-host-death family antitoxin [Ignavibacteriae bacterium]|nr:type II toxin-antitoxin system prevent-host-death family antitoxin [Ignavibacteriota bacterium]
MTYTLTFEEAKQKLEEIIPLLEGNDVILTSNGVPTARILPITIPNTIRKAGSAKGIIVEMSDNFDAPMDEFKEYDNEATS